MQFVDILYKNGNYSCNSNISRKEWLEILKDINTSEGFKVSILRFFYMPERYYTCLGTSKTGDWPILEVAINDDSFTYIDVDTDGYKYGTILVEAIKDYLYWYLIEHYKGLRKRIPLHSKEWDGLYKWEIITRNQGKTPLEIVEGGFGNLIDQRHNVKALNYLLTNKREELSEILAGLVNERASIELRLSNFKRDVSNLLSTTDYNSIPNDESTAASILTCYNPQRYTFYKYRLLYDRLCLFLQVPEQQTGFCYSHYLQLLAPLAQLAANDTALQAIMQKQLSGKIHSDMLLAQDIVWMLLACGDTKRTGYIFNILFPTNEIQDDINTINKTQNDMYTTSKYEKYIRLLEANKNLILTGAPGTGKTYMAREIAKEFILNKVRLYNDYTEDEDFENDAEIEDFCNRISEGHCKMVQFHPSLDYTDFVEGLRPVKSHDNQLGFERKNGVFKDFCERALSFAVTKRRKDGSFIQNDVTISGWYDIYNDCYDIVIKEIQTCNTIYLVGDMDEDSFSVDIDGRNIIYNKIHWIDNRQESYELFYSLMGSDYNVFHNGYLSQPDIEKELFQLREHKIGSWERIKSNEEIKEISRFYCFLFMAFVDHAKKNYERINLPAVFIIDEINRGEISKIFGELFFSIDPGYRGEKGRVPTQYQNMVEEYDVFAKGFYVPENVYIIGTMNDIDRSVESMDFAMRRRFAFEEVTAEESYQNMIAESDDFNKDEKTEIKKRMLALNNAILKPELRLGEAYQIGAAYFRKYLYYKELGMEQAFTMLWKNHLKGLLFEYLRGNQNAEAQLEDLEKAYNQKAETHEETDSDNG